MTRHLQRRHRSRLAARLVSAALLVVASAGITVAGADDVTWIGAQPNVPKVDARASGVLAESYGYHRQSPMIAAATSPTAPAAGQPPGWYGYGFPVQTYRWGWFGAAHYYPTVLWHHGYNGDECRWGYRCGY